jgi:hypothetical protein
MVKGLPACHATAARVFMGDSLQVKKSKIEYCVKALLGQCLACNAINENS